MKFPELLYTTPLAKELRVQRVEHARRVVTAAPNPPNAFLNFGTTPADRFTVITDFGCRWLPETPATALRSLSIWMNPVGTTQLQFSSGLPVDALGSGAQFHVGSDCEVWIPPNYVFGISATFTGSTGTHVLEGSMGYFSITRGNVTRL